MFWTADYYFYCRINLASCYCRPPRLEVDELYPIMTTEASAVAKHGFKHTYDIRVLVTKVEPQIRSSAR